jgi:hypothetical protein
VPALQRDAAPAAIPDLYPFGFATSGREQELVDDDVLPVGRLQEKKSEEQCLRGNKNPFHVSPIENKTPNKLPRNMKRNSDNGSTGKKSALLLRISLFLGYSLNAVFRREDGPRAALRHPAFYPKEN